jgi:hypothetical protein
MEIGKVIFTLVESSGSKTLTFSHLAFLPFLILVSFKDVLLPSRASSSLTPSSVVIFPSFTIVKICIFSFSNIVAPP